MATQTVTTTVTIETSVQAGGSVLDAGRYLIELPSDYDPAEVTGEDVLLDSAIRVVERLS